MPKVIRDHHNLRRNLNLNDKYISNDGGDEGIRITDAGLVGIGVTDPDSSLEIMSTGNILKLSRDADDYLLFTQQDSGGDAILESTGGFQFKIAAGDNLTFYEGGNQKFLLGLSGTTTKFRMSYSVGDYFLIETDNNGVTTMSTVQDSVADANLTLDVDGDLILDPDSGITKFYLAGDTDDLCTLTVAANGATTLATADSDGEVGHLTLAPDGDTIIDRNVADTTAGTFTGLSIDFDKTGTSTSNNTLYGLNIDIDNTTATNGVNTMYGIYCTPTLTHAADAGTVTTIGGYFKAEGGTNGTTKNIGLQIEQMPISDNSLGLQITSNADTEDYFSISTGTAGATTIATVDSDAAVAHLTLDPDGDINLNAIADVNIPADIGLTFGDAGEKIEGDGTDLTITSSRHLALVTGTDAGSIYLDSGTGIFNFRDEQDPNDLFKITVAKNTGATILETVSEHDDGHLTLDAGGHVVFEGCAVGFGHVGGDFGESPAIGGGGPNTDIDFRLGNKSHIEMGANLDSASGEYLNLIFPDTSGNFLLVIGQDGTGSRTISSGSWRAYEVGESLCANALFANGTDGVIRWAGGSAPTLTTTADKADIISIYWDADTETAFAVVSQDF